MLLFIHDRKKSITLLDDKKNSVDHKFSKNTIAENFIDVAVQFPDELILWCREELISSLQLNDLNEIFHHNRVMASYGTTRNSFLPLQLGYIDRTCFLKINKEVTYPTWLMSSDVGGIHASVINHLEDRISVFDNFDYFLNSLSKLGMDYGLFCYSEPKLLSQDADQLVSTEVASTYTLFKFVKQHHKWVWIYFLALSYAIYERKFMLLPLLKSLKHSQLKSYKSLDQFTINSTRKVVKHREIDVIIPTIGRKEYLYDVLKDLSKQTILPRNVIIVEQNPNEDSLSELDYLTNQEWPFTIKHIFTHQAGVCNARNTALSQVTSEWTLLGDDDNRFQPDLIEKLFDNVELYGTKVGITVYLQPHEVQTYMETGQTGIFGAGNGIIKSELIHKIQFDMRFEFNYGEDSDFGNQLRHIGEDVIFFADVKIDHLKAPIGGYRRKVLQQWDNEEILPNPSPTIQLLYQTYFTQHQILGYKLLLKFRSYKCNSIKNPISYVKNFNKQWEQSLLWANKL